MPTSSEAIVQNTRLPISLKYKYITIFSLIKSWLQTPKMNTESFELIFYFEAIFCRGYLKFQPRYHNSRVNVKWLHSFQTHATPTQTFKQIVKTLTNQCYGSWLVQMHSIHSNILKLPNQRFDITSQS